MSEFFLSAESLRVFWPVFYDGLLRTGLAQPLQDFQPEPADPKLEKALQALAQDLIAGQDWEQALKSMPWRFPAVMEHLLILGHDRAQLDVVVAWIIEAYAHHEAHQGDDTEEPALNVLDALSARVRSYELQGGSSVICVGCVQRELQKIMARASLESAHQVYLSQVGDQFFQQSYIGAKVVHVKEACHRLTYTTLLQSLKAAAVSGQWEAMETPLNNELSYRVAQKGEQQFQVKDLTQHPAQTLEIIFQTVLDLPTG